MNNQTQQSESANQGSTDAGGAAEQQTTAQDQGAANFMDADTSGDGQNIDAESTDTGQSDSGSAKNFMDDDAGSSDEGGEQSQDDAESSSEEGTEDGTSDGAPEEYAEFNMPEGMVEDKALTEKVTPLFKEMNLSQEQAQKLVDAYAPHVQEVATQAVDNHIAQIEEAVRQENQKNFETLMAMPNRDQVKGFVNDGLKFLAQTDDEAAYLRADGNNPLLVNMLARLGQQIGEGSFVEGSGGRGEQTSAEKLDAMYPSMSAKGN